MVADAAVTATKHGGLQQFELSARFGASHPLCNTAFRDISLQGYAVVFGMGGCFIYAVYMAFLGPAFVMGMCRAFAPSVTQVWVAGLGPLECARSAVSAMVAGGVVNGAQPT